MARFGSDKMNMHNGKLLFQNKQNIVLSVSLIPCPVLLHSLKFHLITLLEHNSASSLCKNKVGCSLVTEFSVKMTHPVSRLEGLMDKAWLVTLKRCYPPWR